MFRSLHADVLRQRRAAHRTVRLGQAHPRAAGPGAGAEGALSRRRSWASSVEPPTAAGITAIAPKGMRKHTCVATPNPRARAREARSNRRRSRRSRPRALSAREVDRKSVVEGKSVSERVDVGGRRIIKKKISTENQHNTQNII